MFCQKCGTAMPDTAAACPSCAAPVAQAHAAPAAAVADTVKAASKDAVAALKSLAGNPVGALAPAYEGLGDAKALRCGVAFGVVSLVCFLLGGYLMLPPYMKQDLFEFLRFGGVMKSIFFAIVPFLCTAVGALAVRKVFGGQGGLGGDCFIAGAALLPASICMILSGLLGMENYQVVLVVSVFAGCIGIMMLFAGFTRISKLTDRAATIAVPIVVVLAVWLAKVVSTSVLTRGGPSDFPY